METSSVALSASNSTGWYTIRTPNYFDLKKTVDRPPCSR